MRSRIAEKKREQAIQDAVYEARKFQASGDLPGALQSIKTSLAAFAADPTLHALQSEFQQLLREQEEQVRREQENILRLEELKSVAAQLEREPGLDAKKRILEAALRKYPDEVSLQRQLADLRGLAQRLTQSAQKAKELEESRQYAQAIELWQEIGRSDPGSAASESSLERLRGLQRKEAAAGKAAIIDRTQGALAAYDLEQIPDLLTQAKAEFPSDPQILELEKTAVERSTTRAKALKQVTEAEKLFAQRNWQEGVASTQAAVESAHADLLIRQQAVSALTRAAESALLVEWQSAENLVRLVSQLDPSSPKLAKLQAGLEQRKQESAIAEHLL